MAQVVATAGQSVAGFLQSRTFAAVLTGMTGYFVYPNNDRLVGFVRKHEWLRYVFLFILIWQGQGEKNMTRSALAVAIIYVFINYVVPMLESRMDTF